VIDLSHFDDGLLGISLRRGPATQTLLHAWHESRIQVIDSIDPHPSIDYDMMARNARPAAAPFCAGMIRDF